MFLDDLAQCWGIAGGLPRLRVGMTVGEGSCAVTGGRLMSGDLHFVVGDPTGASSPVALSGVLHAWREIGFDAQANSDYDESFWSGASLVAEYLASELGAPNPKKTIGRRGQPLLRFKRKGVVDGVPASVKFSADGLTEEGISMYLTILPERPWFEVIADALTVGEALPALVQGPGGLAPGSTRSLPSNLDGSYVEVLRAVDGALRVRVAEGPRFSEGKLLAGTAVGNVRDLLERLSPREQEVKGVGRRSALYLGLTGPGGPYDVQLTDDPEKGMAAELLIRSVALPPGSVATDR